MSRLNRYRVVIHRVHSARRLKPSRLANPCPIIPPTKNSPTDGTYTCNIPRTVRHSSIQTRSSSCSMAVLRTPDRLSSSLFSACTYAFALATTMSVAEPLPVNTSPS